MFFEKKHLDSGGIRTHAFEKTGALNQRLRPLGHAIYLDYGFLLYILKIYVIHWINRYCRSNLSINNLSIISINFMSFLTLISFQICTNLKRHFSNTDRTNLPNSRLLRIQIIQLTILSEQQIIETNFNSESER